MRATAPIVGVFLALLLVTLPVPVSLAAVAAVAFAALVLCSPRIGLPLWLISTPVLSYWIVLPLGAGVPDLTYDRGFVVAMAIALLLRQQLGLDAPFRIGSTEVAMAVFLLVAGLSLVKSDDVPRDLQLLLDSYAIPFLLYWIARSLFTRAPVGFLPPVLATLGIVLVGLGCVQMLVGRVPLIPDGARRLHADRMTSTFINAAELGGVVAMTGCACLAASALTRSFVKRWTLLGAAAIHFVGVALSLTRAAWIAAVAGAGVLAWKDARARRVVAWGLAGVCVAGLAAIPFLLDAQSIEARASEQAPIFNRIISVVTALRMWVEKPFLGWGFGRWVYAVNSRDFLTPVGSIAAEWGAEVFVPHDEFLHTLVMTGAVGLGCQLVILRNALRVASSWRSLDAGSGRWLGLGLGAALAIFAIDGLFADLIFFEFHARLFFVLFGATAGLLDSRTATEPHARQEEGLLAPSPAAH